MITIENDVEFILSYFSITRSTRSKSWTTHRTARWVVAWANEPSCMNWEYLEDVFKHPNEFRLWTTF